MTGESENSGEIAPATRATILVVDDESSNRALLRAMLPEYDVIEADSGRKALAIVDRERVDLVLLDVMMPDVTGFDVCRAIKERPRVTLLPVLLITALAAQDQKNLGLQAGADDFLTKPVDRRELLLRVRAFLKLRAQEEVIQGQLHKLSGLQALKDEMLGLLVHDLRSPLSCVLANLQFLAEELPPGQALEDAQAALGGADLMRVALEEMLEIRLIEEERLPIARTPVELPLLVEGVTAMFAVIARRKQIALSGKVEGARVALLDGRLARRAVENLVNNALKYTPVGRDVVIDIRHDQGAVVFDVADRGPGIPAEHRSAVFEKFGSIETRKSGARRGVGLGLYLVGLVARGHGGEAEVLDREGGGAVFRLRLPAT